MGLTPPLSLRDRLHATGERRSPYTPGAPVSPRIVPPTAPVRTMPPDLAQDQGQSILFVALLGQEEAGPFAVRPAPMAASKAGHQRSHDRVFPHRNHRSNT